MILLKRSEFVKTLNQYAEQKINELLQLLRSSNSLVDQDFAEQTISALSSFASIIQKQCLQDTTLFTQNVAFAQRLVNDYETFGDYCYEILQQAFKATNESLLANNKLMYDISRFITFEVSDFVVTSNYIALNNFSNVAKLELTNFRNMYDVGLYYDIRLSAKQLATSNIIDKLENNTLHYIEMTEFLQLLNNSNVQDLLKDWTDLINDKLKTAKHVALTAWHATYAALRDLLHNAILQKQVGRCICNMHIVNDKISETLCYANHTKTIDWQNDRNMLLLLDYFNNLNFRFVDD